jgi:hypothetical protein
MIIWDPEKCAINDEISIFESPAKRSFHRRDAEYAEIILM